MSGNEQEHGLSQGSDIPEVPAGLALRRARELAGLTTAQVAERLKLRTAVIEAMEREDLEALGAPVFARGFVTGYANLLGLPVGLANQMLPREEISAVEPAPLQSTRKVSQNRHLLDRYARRLVYIALTALIVVPVVLLPTRDKLPDPVSLLVPLDTQPSDSADVNDPSRVPLPQQAQQMGPPSPASDHAVMASFTSFYNQTRATAPVPAAVEPAPSRGLVLELSGDSWVEVIGNDGSRLVHELLRAGTQREFDPTQVARVLLGNAAAVEVRLNGAEIDVAPFQRANVARFTLSSDGTLEPVGG